MCICFPAFSSVWSLLSTRWLFARGHLEAEGPLPGCFSASLRSTPQTPMQTPGPPKTQKPLTICVHIYMYVSLSLSPTLVVGDGRALSLSLYIYICLHTYVYIHKIPARGPQTVHLHNHPKFKKHIMELLLCNVFARILRNMFSLVFASILTKKHS